MNITQTPRVETITVKVSKQAIEELDKLIKAKMMLSGEKHSRSDFMYNLLLNYLDKIPAPKKI
jgi:metal-responsive CopG/Arc/MetJ family transcriptional regulator